MSDSDSGAAKLLMIGTAVASVLALLLAVVSLVLILDLRSDAAKLVEQSRKSAKNIKNLQEKVDEMAETVETSAKAKAPEAVPVHMDAADPKNDCVIRPGDNRGGLVDCLNGPSR